MIIVQRKTRAERNCWRKPPFDSEIEAKRAARKRHPDRKLYVYRCSVCGKWHHTSKRPR